MGEGGIFSPVSPGIRSKWRDRTWRDSAASNNGIYCGMILAKDGMIRRVLINKAKQGYCGWGRHRRNEKTV